MFGLTYACVYNRNEVTFKKKKKPATTHGWYLTAMEHWSRLPREAVESLSLELFRTPLDAFLCELL